MYPTNYDFSAWGLPSAQQTNPLSWNMGGMVPQGVTDASGAQLTPAAAATPAQEGGFMSGLGGWLSNGQNLGALVQGLGSLGQVWLGMQSAGAAKDALNFQKRAFETNLRNSTQAYNTSLEDRIRGRTSDYAGKEQDVQAYLTKHSLSNG